MINGINKISPDIRDFLLKKNLIVSDSILNSGLVNLGNSLGNEGNISSTSNVIKPSDDINESGKFYRNLNLIYNSYRSINQEQEINITDTINSNSNQVEYQQRIGSKDNGSNFSKDNNQTRENILNKNKYFDKDLIYEVNLNTIIQSNSNSGAYDFRSSLKSRTIDFILNSTNLGGVSQQFNNAQLPNTKLEEIANKQILKHFGYNAAFGAAQETLGHINLNPLSLLQGNDIIVPNYAITVPKGKFGGVVDFFSRVTGVESPVSLLAKSSSIFNDENPISNIDRINSQIDNTGRGQVLSLIENLNKNKYKPTITDNRKGRNINKGDKGTNGKLYAFEIDKGVIKDLLNTHKPNLNEDNIPPFIGDKPNPAYLQKVVKNIEFETNYGKITSENDENFNDDFDDLINLNAGLTNEKGITKFTWGDDNLNQNTREIYTHDTLSVRKSLLYKTQTLFNSNKIKTLITGRGDGKTNPSEIQSNLQNVNGTYFLSKGSGVLNGDVALGKVNINEDTSANKVFCRTWTTLHKYNQVSDLQKNDGLFENAGTTIRKNVENSVLEDNGFVRIAPTKNSSGEVDVKRFMFSIENLAWSDSLGFLPECEVGPGDPITGTKGRIMWFPPYEINFTDSSSVSWDTTKFIGRGEPIYTYNNTERSGTLQWKIIIDHPTYVNDLRNSGYDDNVFASAAAGCLDLNNVIEAKETPIDKDKKEVANTQKIEEIEAPEVVLPESFKIYFPNDVTSIPTDYENGDGQGLGKIMADEGYITSQTGSLHPYDDNTDFGLNSCLSGNCSEGQKINLDGKTYDGWLNNSYLDDLAEFIINKCPTCKISISGYASKDGQTEAPDANQRLSDDRAKNVKNFLYNILLLHGDPNINQRFEFVKGQGATGCNKSDSVDDLCKKKARYVKIEFRNDPTIGDEVKKHEKPKEKKITNENVKTVGNKFFTECDYFKKIEKEDPFIYNAIKEKIKYFHPSFHSTTPEGFNSRLNFLLQCTRQGPTINGDITTNLSFGKPPVCILRVGDFYHTKIIVESVEFSFDPLVWDINPEGVGVQPMICNVNMSFKFIGGSSLQGPINRLQNAVSFNFFANTEIYDDRADYIKISTSDDLSKSNTKAKLVNGINPNNYDKPPMDYKNKYGLKEGIGNSEELDTNQEKRV